jgi:predicted GNAT superfamily acetyltransferase
VDTAFHDTSNPESRVFHSKIGFARGGEQDAKSGSLTIALFAGTV